MNIRRVNILRGFCLTGVFALSGCSHTPDAYAPPMQRQPLDGAGNLPVVHIVNMNDPNADAYLVKDISKSVESGSWRWTNRRPELRFYLDSVSNLKFKMDFAIAESTFQKTGPVTLSFFVNNTLLDKVRYDQSGYKHFEKPVPQAMLISKSINTAAVESDKVFTSPADGAILNFILIRAGFTQ